ncbi:MAG: hypothetical protein JSR80_03055 [Verrucomicrobia bacterium]|nr:hypothetical protein [Verrucomicrobiota bacterium]
MRALLTRLHLLPQGVKYPDGSWRLVQPTHGSPCSSDLLAQQASNAPNFFVKHSAESRENWEQISSAEVVRYLRTRHPQLQFFDFSERCDLLLITYIQAIGTSSSYWIGGHAGASHFIKSEAKNRAISEVMERTVLAELKVPLSIVWGSGVAPHQELAQLKAIEEGLERWITYNAWVQSAGFHFYEVSRHDFATSSLAEMVLFEWGKYSPEISYFIIENPYFIPVVLVRIRVSVADCEWCFFGNGIGDIFLHALNKSLLETLQFIPGKEQLSWLLKAIETKSSDARIADWKITNIDLIKNKKSNLVAKEKCENLISQDMYAKQGLEILNKIGGYVEAYSVGECPGIYLACAYLPGKKHWSDYKGVPIA